MIRRDLNWFICASSHINNTYASSYDFNKNIEQQMTPFFPSDCINQLTLYSYHYYEITLTSLKSFVPHHLWTLPMLVHMISIKTSTKRWHLYSVRLFLSIDHLSTIKSHWLHLTHMFFCHILMLPMSFHTILLKFLTYNQLFYTCRKSPWLNLSHSCLITYEHHLCQFIWFQ